MDKEKIITELMDSPKYKERADVRAVVDEAAAELQASPSKAKIKEVLDLLKEKLAEVLNLPNPRDAGEEPLRALPRNMAAIKTAINALHLTNEAKENLKKMFEGYDEAVDTAKEIHPQVQIKTLAEVYKGFAKLGIEKIKEIGAFEKPTLLVIPNNSFMEKIAAMDANKKYENQAETSVWTDRGSPFESVTTKAETVISIVDGEPHMPHIPGIASDSRYDARKTGFKAHFAKKGMRLINANEAVMLQQLSLRDYKLNGEDTSRIVDYCDGNSADTYSCLDDTDLTNTAGVACAYFGAGNRRVNFHANPPAYEGVYLRGRPSVQVMAY